MPLHGYHCDNCQISVEEYRTIDEGGEARRPACPGCGRIMYRDQNVQAMDAKEPGQRYTVLQAMRERDPRSGQIRDYQRPIEVDSMHKLRQIEADSERRYRNGEGEPLRFRALHQNRSNMDVNSFGTAGRIGDRSYDSGVPLQKNDRLSVRRHGTQAPDRPTVPGAGQSPLKG